MARWFQFGCLARVNTARPPIYRQVVLLNFDPTARMLALVSRPCTRIEARL